VLQLNHIHFLAGKCTNAGACMVFPDQLSCYNFNANLTGSSFVTLIKKQAGGR
jgi:hypothetical protein